MNDKIPPGSRGHHALRAGLPAEAERAFRDVLHRQPDDPAALHGLAVALHDQRRFAEAEAALIRARPATPALAEYHLSLLRLLQGDGAGWRGWEARLRVPGLVPVQPALPRWDGLPIPDGRLLLLAEQGFGDCLQFLCFLPAAERASGARITLGLPDALAGLLRPWAERLGVAIATGRLALEGFTHVAHLGSLPLLLGVAEAAPAGQPWLSADPVQVTTWQRRRPAGLRVVGFCWEGRASHPQDARRSLPPALLQGHGLPGTILTGLQRPPLRSPPPPGLLAMDWGPDIADFAAAAAMLSALDGLVTVDTAMAHLAGALGRPAVVLLPWVPDWRWGLNGERTPWYPSLRLARQPAPGDWPGAWAQVRPLLDELTTPAG